MQYQSGKNLQKIPIKCVGLRLLPLHIGARPGISIARGVILPMLQRYDSTKYKAGQRGGVRGALLLLLLGAMLCLWQLGAVPVAGDVPKAAVADVLRAGLGREFAADGEGIARWQQYRAELAEAAAKVQVAVYSTHSSESYTAYSGESKVYGELGGVYCASAVLADELAGAGIGAVVDETIHDWPDWNKSYANSLQTAEGLLAAYPNLRLLVDMHRDAGVSRADSVAMINGKMAAKIMLVCGSDKRYTHPNWRQNQALMEEIADKMEEMYPGLLRRVSVQTGRYNQHISPRAILVEMGTTENTIDEVEYAARLLADVLVQVLAGE